MHSELVLLEIPHRHLDPALHLVAHMNYAKDVCVLRLLICIINFASASHEVGLSGVMRPCMPATEFSIHKD